MDISFYLKRLKDSVFYFGAALVKLPIAIFTSPIFAKNLSASDYAAIGYFNTLSTFLMPIIALMFYNYYMTGYHERTKKENGAILQSLVSFLLIIDVIIVILAYFALNYYLITSGSKFDAHPLGLIVLTTSMFNMGFGFWGLKLRFERKSFYYFILQTSVMLFSTALGLLLVVKFQMGAIGRLLPTMIFKTGLFVLFFYLFIKQFKLDFVIIRKALIFCYPLVLSGLLTIPIIYLDKILLERLHNNDEFGLYNIAGTITGYFGLTTTALLQTFQPDIFRYVDKKNKHSLLQIFLVMLGFFIIGGLIFYSISGYAVEYLTAGRYTGAIKYIWLFIIVTCMQPISYFLAYVIIALKFTKLDLINKVIIAILSISSYHYLISYYHYFGALYAKILVLTLLSVIIVIEILNRNSKVIRRFRVNTN